MQNNSPFQQQITLQPAIQCMYAANTAGQAPPPAAGATVNAADTVMFQYALVGGCSEPSKSTPGLYGWEKGLKAPGNQKTLTTDLVNAANAAGQSALKVGDAGPQLLPGRGGRRRRCSQRVKFVLSFLGPGRQQVHQHLGLPAIVRREYRRDRLRDQRRDRPDTSGPPATNTWAGHLPPATKGRWLRLRTARSSRVRCCRPWALRPMPSLLERRSAGAMVSP